MVGLFRRGINYFPAIFLALLLIATAATPVFRSASIPVALADGITSAEYLDQDNDGTVDVIRWTIDEIITSCTYEAADWSVNTAGDIGVTAITNAVCGASTIDISVTTSAGVTGGPTDPVISYTDAATAGSITLNTSGAMTDKLNQPAQDATSPIITAADLSNNGSRNQLVLTYSEPMTVANGASSAALGDLTSSGQLTGLGNFDTPGDATVPTTKNTVSSAGNTVTITFADQAGGFFNSSSTTEPSGNFTPVASTSVIDANSNQVNTTVDVASASTSWELTKPTLTSITIADAAGSNGKVDQATIVFSDAVRDTNITDADATLGAAAGTFTSGTANDNTTTFNLSADTLAFDTSATAADFLYSGTTTPITDLFGNLLDTTTDGQIDSGDSTEIDGATPILTPVSISSDNADTSLATANDTVTISFTASEPLNAIAVADVQIDGNDSDAFTNTAGNDYEATRVMQSGDTPGAIAFTIDFADAAGNNGAQVSATTDASSVTFDETAPTITDAQISIAGGTGTSGEYIIGDTITVTWDAASDGNTDIASATANLSGWGGNAAEAMTDTTACGGTDSDGIYEACYDLVAGVIDATNVNVTVSATDNAGNSTGPVSDSTNATVDNEAPSISDNGTLTISTDNGVASIAAVNGGATAADKVTQSTVTIDNPDGDTQVTDFTGLTGQNSVANGVETTDVVAGALDNAA